MSINLPKRRIGSQKEFAYRRVLMILNGHLVHRLTEQKQRLRLDRIIRILRFDFILREQGQRLAHHIRV